ncbi:diacylglycerol/lipid kinase family protein [Pelagibacterium luteolum]|uniref:Diacylglycerol kinase family enzyme n=1 Tax=Pelagibacterium luteolum TaxID=440168 RepID=A0A1G7ZJA3_9HYPH|nr:diacylglycerol kinase family protein [Pelagibacterium luteolum]SDH08793.1 Diacylglycerol kinase family enzyme [Pelagibacterium luteolum]
MTQRRFHLVLNVNSGTVQALGVTEPDLEAMFKEYGLEVEIDADPDLSLDQRIEKALASDADTVIAAGGDGTVTALATAVIDSDKSLAILPLGTANLLARDLGLPLDLKECVAALAAMEPLSIDVSEVNGTIFLHKAVIGVLPELAAGRERIRGEGWGAKIGYMRYFFRRLSRARRLALEISTGDGQTRIERVQSIAVACNAYDEGLGRFFHRDKLDTGLLTIYVLRHLNAGDIFRLAAGMIAGRWRDDEAIDISTARSVSIRSKKPRLQAMIDGEVQSVEVPLNFKIYPRALTVLAPIKAVKEELAEDQAENRSEDLPQAARLPA